MLVSAGFHGLPPPGSILTQRSRNKNSSNQRLPFVPLRPFTWQLDKSLHRKIKRLGLMRKLRRSVPPTQKTWKHSRYLYFLEQRFFQLLKICLFLKISGICYFLMIFWGEFKNPEASTTCAATLGQDIALVDLVPTQTQSL